MLSILSENIKKAYRARSVQGIISHKYKLIYFPIPKVATSTVKRFLAEKRAVETKTEKESNFKFIHDYEFPTVEEKELRKYDDYYRFAIVRNPIDRIYSCYKDKIIRRLENNSVLYPGFSRYNKISGIKIFKRDMSFPQFVKSISLIPDSLSDEHFRSQYLFIPNRNRKLIINRLLKFENLSIDLPETFSEVGLKFPNDYQVNATIEQERNIEMDSKSLYRIKKRYELDFDIFKYHT